MAKRGTTAKSARRRARKAKRGEVVGRKKEFTYRGYTLEELQKMSIEELIEILPARARRSIKRGLLEKHQKFWKKVERGDKVIRTHDRDIIILPSLVGRKVAVHKGNSFEEITIKPEMIGHYLGEFALTRKMAKHTGVGVGATRSSKHLPLK